MLIKICGMRRPEDLEYASSLGAKMCGFIFHPESPRYIDPASVGRLPSFGMLRIGVFVNQETAEIEEIYRIARLDYIQLHGSQDIQCARALGRERIIRVVWPERYSDIERLNAHLDKLAPACSYFLMDAGLECGGSGKSLKSHLLENIRSPLPWILAGGLSPDNISALLETFSPAGVDINSGIEKSPGIKDHEKMKALFAKLDVNGVV